MIGSIYIFRNIFNLVLFNNNLDVLLFVVIGALFYFIFVFLLGGIKKEYFSLILNSIKK
jgi:ABC-type bacteriocin/lantibiotic exporter with double-glycine peptidase domain